MDGPAPVVGTPAPQGQSSESSDKTVWVKNGATIHPKQVQVGVTDEIHYEVLSGLKEGDEVVVSMTAATAAQTKAATAAKSPFMPQRPGSNRKTTTTATTAPAAK